MKNKYKPKFELVLGLVAPIGIDKTQFITFLKSELEIYNIKLKHIEVTNKIFNTKDKNINFPKSFKYFLKMQMSSVLRKNSSSPGILVHPIISSIINARKVIETEQDKTESAIVYLVDQLKNTGEYKILKHIYNINYIQLSLFSNEDARDHLLEKWFDADKDLLDIINKNDLLKKVIKNISIYKKPITKYFNRTKIKEWIDDYIKHILKDASSELIIKDYNDTDPSFSEGEDGKKMNIKSGQQVADLFHRSNYFINIDNESDSINAQIKKFIKMLLGKYEEYPAQDEFGMSLAYQASVRSNFPGSRHVGAAIISEHGEVLSVASIRAPSGSSNTTLHDMYKIKSGYDDYKNKIDTWVAYLKILPKKDIDLTKQEISKFTAIPDLKEIWAFIDTVLDFHPCTHAEIAAICDAAKIGISIRNATLYTTTYPCHLCAKDIISAGIKRVVYLEAYPKSKNKELYLKILHIDQPFESEKIPFEPYCGINPKNYLSMYSLDNHLKDKEEPIFTCEKVKYYKSRENDVLMHLDILLNKALVINKDKEPTCKNIYLCNLIHPKNY